MAQIPGKKNPSNREFESMLELFEKAIRDLEIEYEKYFNGTERRPPVHQRRQIGHLSREIDAAYITNTALKFRARQLQNRLITLQTYWNRVMRQIEEGTYIRDKRKAAQRAQEAEERRRLERQEEAQPVYDLSQDLGSFSFDDLAAELAATFDAIQTAKPAQPSAPAPARMSEPSRPPTPAPTPSRIPQANPANPTPRQPPTPQRQPPSRDDAEARAVYERYLAARRQCNQSTDISFDRLRESMQSQRSSIREKKGVQNVGFDVVIKNGQAFLKPTPKDE